MKKYFICADVHGFYNELIKALNENGFDINNQEHILLICGDSFDRGSQACEMLKFIKNLAKQDRLIYIRGNHEDLLENLYNETKAGWNINDCHFHNRTIDTFEQLASWIDPMNFLEERLLFWNEQNWWEKDQAVIDKNNAKREKGLKKVKSVINWINKHTVDYIELGNYIFVHGWIPCEKWDKFGDKISNEKTYDPDWRNASSHDWKHARWLNGMQAAQMGIIEPSKTIVCGHWHCSWGHCYVLHDCPDDYGKDANYDIYRNNGIIALDTCTAATRRVNILVLTEEEMGIKNE